MLLPCAVIRYSIIVCVLCVFVTWFLRCVSSLRYAFNARNEKTCGAQKTSCNVELQSPGLAVSSHVYNSIHIHGCTLGYLSKDRAITDQLIHCYKYFVYFLRGRLVQYNTV